MKLKEIYSKFNTPPNLQQHMLRVAGVCKLLLDQLEEHIVGKEDILTAALLHDLGNIIKFDFEKYPDVGDSKHDTSYWLAVKSEFVAKYGANEHHGTLSMLRELGVNPNVIAIVDGADWPNILKDNRLNDNTLLIYADMRVSPNSVVDLEVRLDDLIERDRAKGRPIELNGQIKPKALQLEAEIEKLVDTSMVSELNVSNLANELLNTEIFSSKNNS